MKALIYLFLCFLVLTSFFSPAVSALLECSELGDGAEEAKTPASPLFIEIPMNTYSMYQLQDANIKIYVNNPDVRRDAKVIYFYLTNQNLHAVPGGKEVYESGQFERVVSYNGEPVVELGLRNWNYYLSEDYPSEVQATFYALQPYPEGDEYEKYQKERSNEDSPWHDFDCTDLSGEAYCNGAKSCKGCIKEVGKVYREYPLSKTKILTEPPKSVSFTANAENGKNGNLAQYYEFRDDTNPQCYKNYQISVSARSDKFEDVPKFMKAGSGESITNVNAPSGGMLGKNAVELRGGDANNDLPACGSAPYCSQPMRYQFNYHVFAELDPPGSGMLELMVTRTDCALPDARKKAIEDSIKEGQDVMISYKAQDMGADGSYEGKTCYWPKTESKGEISGRISDGHGHPMPYINVTLEFDGNEYFDVADKDGVYSVSNIPNFEPNEDNPPEATLSALLSYYREDKNYYDIRDRYGEIIMLKKTFKLKTEDDLAQDLDFMIINYDYSADNEIKYNRRGLFDLEEIHNVAAIYHYMSDAVDFALTDLNANIDYQLPVEVYIKDGGVTSYSPSNSGIKITPNDVPFENIDRPKNREYHEFSHHIMYANYGGWPDDGVEGSINHEGYINPTTGDSYAEGFAEFMAMVISDKNKDDPEIAMPPESYSVWGSMDNNYRSWDNYGSDEEFAVAGTLWDLYSDENDDQDTIAIPIEDMWKILKVKRTNFYEIYQAFKAAYPSKAQDIDTIFINHGFYYDKNPGNGVRDNDEPIRDSNQNGLWDDEDMFVDYPEGWSYTQGDEVGRGTNYNRPERSLAGLIPNAFIKVPDTEVHFYKVSVHYNNPQQGKDYEYRTEVREGLLYLMPLPGNVDATLTVKPDSQDYTTENIYTITTQEYNTKYYAAPLGQGYFDEHTFNLQPTGTQNDKPYETVGGAESKWETDGGYKAPSTETSEEESSSTCCCLPALSLILAGAGAIIGKIL